MKKALIILLMTLSIFGIFKLNEYTLIEAKIFYEVSSSKTSLTLDSVSSSLEKLDNICVLTRINYGEFKYECNLDNDATMEEVNAYRDAKRAYGKNYHTERNNKAFSTINISNYNSYYISMYSPYIEYNFDSETFNSNKEEILKKVSSHKDVAHVVVREGSSKSEDKIYNVVDQAKINTYYYDDDEYMGSGINIGILETGIMDVTNDNFTNTTCYTFDQFLFNEPVTEHATTMASIIGGEYGIAPEATLYSTAITGNIIQEVDWLINRNVDVINMSCGENNPTGIYGSQSSYVDYMVKNYDVVGVAAIGNSGASANIHNPGLGYNIIGVGTSVIMDRPWSRNSLNVVSGPKKPTVLAPGESVYVENMGPGHTGTSVSCAVTTGCVALLLEEYPILKTKPMQVVSLFVAGAVRQDGHVIDKVTNGFDRKSGAGRIDLKKTMDTFYKTTTITNINPTIHIVGTCVYEFSVYIAGNQNLRAAFSWPATPNLDNNTASFTKYTAAIYDDYGNCLAFGSSVTENVVLASCIVPEEGRYYMRLYQDDLLVGEEDKIYFAYRYR